VAIERAATDKRAEYLLEEIIRSSQGYTRLVREVCLKALAVHGKVARIPAALVNNQRELWQVHQVDRFEKPVNLVKGAGVLSGACEALDKDVRGTDGLDYHPVHNQVRPSGFWTAHSRRPSFEGFLSTPETANSRYCRTSREERAGRTAGSLSFNKQSFRTDKTHNQVFHAIMTGMKQCVSFLIDPPKSPNPEPPEDLLAAYLTPYDPNQNNACDNRTYRNHKVESIIILDPITLRMVVLFP
jgi:hypothetical protein